MEKRTRTGRNELLVTRIGTMAIVRKRKGAGAGAGTGTGVETKGIEVETTGTEAKTVTGKNQMKIVAEVIFHQVDDLNVEKNPDLNVEGIHSFHISHDEGILIDYDYLYSKVHFIEKSLKERVSQHYPTLCDVELDVKYWEVGNSTYMVKNHHKKQIMTDGRLLQGLL